MEHRYPNPGIRERAERRFDGLRRRAVESSSFNDIDTSVPPGWCISTIARIVVNDRALVPAIQEIQSRSALVGKLYQYPEDSLHISLLGCTQREPARPSTEGPRIAAVTQAFDRAIAKVGPTRMHLGGLNVIGTQLFIEVLTDEDAWRSVRERLATELVSIGENPMVHADPEPMHLNIGRLLGPADLGALRQLLNHDRPAVDAPLNIGTIELVITDFVVSPETLTIAKTGHLNNSHAG